MGLNAVELHARASADYAGKVERSVALLHAAAEHGQGVVQSTSLGAEDQVITHLIARERLPIAVATLDTGKLHAPTLELIGRTEQAYGLHIERFKPAHEAVVQFVGRHGERAMYDSVELRKACCALRKLEPLSRMLANRDAWVTGLRREQSNNRGVVGFGETDDKGRAKVNPLADWSWNDVWHYIATRSVPYNPLHDQFMPSIGCAPCTRAIAVGEDFRAGRWWWEDEKAKECGLHVHEEPAVSMIGAPR